MVTPRDGFYTYDRTQEGLIALRGLLSRNPCAAQLGAEILTELLYTERYLSHRVEASEIGCLLEALRVEGEVLA